MFHNLRHSNDDRYCKSHIFPSHVHIRNKYEYPYLNKYYNIHTLYPCKRHKHLLQVHIHHTKQTRKDIGIKNNLTNLTILFLHQTGQDKKSPLYPLFPARKSRVCVYPSTAHVMHCVQDAQPRTVHEMAHSPRR